jgi:hypothetical protein
VASQLGKRGIDVLTAQADHGATLPDHELLARAGSLGRVMVTSDIRFRALAEKWQADHQDFGGLVFAHPLHVTIGQMVLNLELIATVVSLEEIQNQVIFLPL